MQQRVTGLLALYTVGVTTLVVAVGLWAAARAVPALPRVDAPLPNVWRDRRQNDAPAEFVAALPAKRGPRLLLLGSSQVQKARGGGAPLAVRLGAQLPGVEIVDFSAGGQQIVESVALLEASARSIQPDAVVVGVSLFAATRVRPRDSIVQAFRKQAPAVENLQVRFDREISTWLSDRNDALARRREIYQALVETPLKRDLKRFIERARPGSTAQTFTAGPAYPAAAAALREAVRFCAARQIPLVLVDLPFDESRAPRPYLEGEREQFTSLLQALGEEGAFTLDTSRLLAREHFGNYEDGSPDSLHFDSAGHDRVAAAIAALIVEMSGGRHAL